MSRAKLRLMFWRWHRRMGLAAAIFILLLSITGILLNHIDKFTWAKQPLKSSLLLAVYGVELPRLTSFAVDGHWISHAGGDYLYLDERDLAYCHGNGLGLAGAVVYQQLWLVACGGELILFTPQGDVVERLGASYGVPQPLQGLGHCGDSVCLQAGDRYYLLDIEQLNWPQWDAALGSFNAVTARELPAHQRQALEARLLAGSISWERLLLDLHSGRFFQLGPWLMDLVGLFLIALAITGITMWYSGRRRVTRRRR